MTDLPEGLIEVLRSSLVLGKLDEEVLLDLAQELEVKSVHGGDQLLREGDVADSMLIVISGRLRVSRRDADGSIRLYNEISPGETTGEASMILRQALFADVTALRDSCVALLTYRSFDALLQRHPVALNRVFVNAVYRQLRHVERLHEAHRAYTFVVVPLRDSRLSAEIASGLAEALRQYGQTALLRHEELDAAHFDALESRFDYLVFETDDTPSARTLRAFRQSDQLVFAAGAEEPVGLAPIEEALAREAGFVMKRKHLALMHRAEAERPADLPLWQRTHAVERVYPLRAGRRQDDARLARFLTSRAVGVVLGGGGARGFSHLGVLRALEEHSIPVDLVGGNSMGALIGAQYACGVPLDEILERTLRFTRGGERPTLPLISLLSGKRLERDLRGMFGDLDIEQLWCPFFASACNLSVACTTVQDSGPLWRAVLASNSPAGLLPPVLYQGDLLVDGAILDNVPVAAMRTRLGTPHERRRGNGTIIAVDVDVCERMSVDPQLKHLSVLNTLKGHLTRKPGFRPSILSILYRAGHVGSISMRGRTMAGADFCLLPPVSGYPLTAYGRATEIADIGYRHALEEIPRWKKT